MGSTFAREASRTGAAIPGLAFDAEDRARVAAILERSQEGKLIPEERAELDDYLRVDAWLSRLQIEARASLMRAGLEP